MNKLYREIYDACSGGYSLTVPFAQRFFQLAQRSAMDGRGAGFVGQITANAFMKREFGQPLIKPFFATEVDFTHVVDTSGAYVPGHGTPTVILVGRPKKRGHALLVRAVRGVRGEPSAPNPASDGYVWRAIVDQIDKPGSASDWVAVDDLQRNRYFNRFPWILQAGGLELVETIESASGDRLKDDSSRIGFFGDTHADDAFTLPTSGPLACRAKELHGRKANKGDQVRDWNATEYDLMAVPYGDFARLLRHEDLDPAFLRHMSASEGRALASQHVSGAGVTSAPAEPGGS
ncbi:hypothetical protein JNW88_31320, partial [Micromonospora sp. ATA32]|nr:hypothetical protein [Micromonospora sp. ATA32]